ncbi:MAG: DNA replication and repair protein RecF [Spirochaetales bacterium]|nr:DNA replication and repair protein RecF [Spirochaetales bacterium]
MGFERVRYYQFRNLQDGFLDLPARQIFLIGRNGQGKSNFLESLYLLSYGGSFRTRRDNELCRLGEREMAVDGLFTGRDGRHRLEIRMIEGRKRITLDDTPVQDRRDMVSLIPSVAFRHDDMAFVNGPPEMQRWFVDQTLSMYQPTYIDDLRRYRRILRNRNRAIKDGMADLLPVYDIELAEVGIEIQRRRRDVLGAFNRVFSHTFRLISELDSELVLDYRPSWRDLDSVNTVVEHLEQRRDQEYALRTTTSGPHRDRILFRYDGRDFMQIASTGQTRLVALILRTAQAQFFSQTTRRLPVLLLDDVLLELDPQRRSLFVEQLPDSEQRVFTFLPGEPYDAYRTADTLVYSVEDGILRREQS